MSSAPVCFSRTNLIWTAGIKSNNDLWDHSVLWWETVARKGPWDNQWRGILSAEGFKPSRQQGLDNSSLKCYLAKLTVQRCVPVASHLLPSKQVVVDLKEKKPQKRWLIILMSLKTHSQQFSCTTAKNKILAAKWFPSLTPGTPTHLWNFTRRCWNLQILLLLRVQEMFPKNHIAWFPTSQPSVRKHEKPKWLEFLIIANSYMRARKLKMQSNLSLCKIQAANVIPVAS